MQQSARKEHRIAGAERSPWPLRTVLLLVLLAGCAGEFDTVGEALRLLQPGLPDAVQGEPYEQQLHATGGLRPYTFRLESGALPEGLSLENGAIRGTATTTGQYEFSIAVSDGNLNKTVQEFRLNVIDVPPPTFTLAPPQTEVREPVTLRASVGGARNLTAVRALISWDAGSFSLRPDSVSATGGDMALLTNESEGQLQVDLALLGRTLDGDHTLFSFVLEPLVEPASMVLDMSVELLSQSPDPSKSHHHLRQSEGSQSQPVVDQDRESGVEDDPDAEDEPPPVDEDPDEEPEDGEEREP